MSMPVLRNDLSNRLKDFNKGGLMLLRILAILAAAGQFVIDSLFGLELSRVVADGSECLLHLGWCGQFVVVNQREFAVFLVPTG